MASAQNLALGPFLLDCGHVYLNRNGPSPLNNWGRHSNAPSGTAGAYVKRTQLAPVPIFGGGCSSFDIDPALKVAAVGLLPLIQFTPDLILAPQRLLPVLALAFKNKTLAHNNKTRTCISANSPVASSQPDCRPFFN